VDKIRQRGREYFHETLSSREGRAFAARDIANKGIGIDRVMASICLGKTSRE
jgi:hypothetical protein